MSRWFRLYDEMLDDPKVQRLHPALFKILINLWCVASRNDGRLPSPKDLSFSLRMTEDETLRAVSKLAEAGFIDTDAATGEQHPHGWDARQFRSDVSTDRVRAHRKRQKSVKNPPDGGGGKPTSGNVDETFPVTPPDTEQIQIQNSSVANATGTVVPHPAADFCKAIFESGVTLLTATGTPDRQARSLLGRLRKTLNDDPAMLTILRQAEIEQPSEPAAWLVAAVETRNGRRASQPSVSSLRGQRPDPALDLLRQANAELAAEESARSHQEIDSGTWLALPSQQSG